VKRDYWNTAPILPSHKKLLLLNTRQLFFNEEIKDRGISNKIFYNGKNFIFTQREMQILDLIKITHKSKDLAQILNISTRTAEWYLYNLKRKVNAHNKEELVKFSCALEKR
jgi:DNA-binding CsgD family transcriptional regulator